MRSDERVLNACMDPKLLAGGHQAECRCPEVDYEFAHAFIPEPATDAAVKGINALAGPEGGRDR